jgi:hypothetical protein
MIMCNRIAVEKDFLGALLRWPEHMDTLPIASVPEIHGSCYDYPERAKIQFSRSVHSLIFDAICGLYEDDVPIDLVSVHQYLKAAHGVDYDGGPAYLASLVDGVSASTDAEALFRDLLETRSE